MPVNVKRGTSRMTQESDCARATRLVVLEAAILQKNGY